MRVFCRVKPILNHKRFSIDTSYATNISIANSTIDFPQKVIKPEAIGKDRVLH